MGPWSSDRPRVLNSPPAPSAREGEVLPVVRAPQPLAGGGGRHDGHDPLGREPLGHDPHGHALTKSERLAHDLGAHKAGRETEREKLVVFIAGMGVGAFVVVFCAWVVLSIFGDSLKEAMSGGVIIGRSTTQWEQTKQDLAKQEEAR